MRRFAIVLAFSLFAAFGFGAGPARAQGWVALPGGGLGSSPGAVCTAWGAFYDGYCAGFTGLEYNSYGYPVGYNYQVFDGIVADDLLSLSTEPYCAPNLIDLSSATGCATWPAPSLKQLGNTPASRGCLCGDPVDIVNGNLFETVTDYESAGPNKLRFVRYYNSEAEHNSMLGENWRSNYERSFYFGGSPSSTTLLYAVRRTAPSSNSLNPMASGPRGTATSTRR